MTKEEAIERLVALRWALDSLPDEAKILSFYDNDTDGNPSLHVDRETVNAELAEVRSKRLDLETMERYRHVGTVRVFCLVKSPLPEGV